MSHAFRQPRILLALLGTVAALCLGLLSAKPAEATWSNYCGGWLGAWGTCSGAARTVNQTYGWGDQYQVCVAVEAGLPAACSHSAGEGVYSQQLSSPKWAKPFIQNNNNPGNVVHGIALAP